MVSGESESIIEIAEVVREEAKLVPLQNIILGGISQGCATAIIALLSSKLDLGGFIGLCSFLPFQNQIEKWAASTSRDKDNISSHINNILEMAKDTPTDDTAEIQAGLSAITITSPVIKTPIFLAHSRDDDVVPFAPHGEGLRETVEGLGFDVTWKAYENGGHWIHAEYGVDDMAEFVRRVWRS